MFDLDSYAYTNRLRYFHPGEKLAFALGTMLLCLLSPAAVVSLAAFFLMAGVTILRAGIPWRFYLRLLLLPASFLLLSTASVALTVSWHPGVFLPGFFHLGGLGLGVAPGGLDTATRLFSRSLGAVSALYFLSLTTPLTDLLSVLKRLGLPSLLLELMGLTYRFIFILLGTAGEVYLAQSARLGYASRRASYRSLGLLASNLFLKATGRSRLLFAALQARCYDGELRVLEPAYALSRKHICWIVMAEFLLAALAFQTWR